MISVAANAVYLITLVTIDATTKTTSVVVDGMVEIAAGFPEINGNSRIAMNATAKIPQWKKKKVAARVQNNVRFRLLSAMVDVTTTTTTAVVIGIRVTVAAQLAT